MLKLKQDHIENTLLRGWRKGGANQTNEKTPLNLLTLRIHMLSLRSAISELSHFYF